jgi:PAS domain S-box-containing protein
MNLAEQSQLRQVLHRRCDAIADSWYKAIARTSHVPHSAAEVREHLVELTEQATALLLTEPFEHGGAEAIGASLVYLHYVEPETLSRTQEVLAQQLVEGLPADQVATLQPRLAALLGGLTVGFFQQVCETILAEQEQIRSALTNELGRAQEALQEAYFEVEQQVQERTAELRATNESLQREIAERKRAEEALRRAHDELELRVEERTAELTIANKQLNQEIEERKQAEVALEEREKHLRTVVTGAPIILFALDREGVITLSEGKGLDATGAKPGENVGRLVSDVYRDVPQIGENIRCALAGEEFTSIVELADGTFETRYSPLRGQNGEITGVIGVATDITERKRAEEQLLAYQERLRSLASQLSLAEERERRRIATELHDRISQTLAICKIKLGALRASASSTGLVEPLDEIHKLVEEIIQETRSLTFEVSSPILYELGLEPALEWLAEQIQEQYGLLSHFEDDRQPKPLDDDIRVLLFQAVRELLTNVAKHAQAHNVKVSLRRDDSNITITVEDDGIGFDMSEIGSHWSRNEGFGLFSIRERLDYLGAHLEVKSEPGHGTWVTLAAPLKRDEAIAREQ